MIISNSMSTEGLYRQYDSIIGTASLHDGDNVSKAVNDTAVTLDLSGNVRGAIQGLAGNTANSQKNLSYIQATNSSLDSMVEIMGRMNVLSAESLQAGVDSLERVKINDEMDKLKEQLRRIQTEVKKSIDNVDEKERPAESSFDDMESVKLLRDFFGAREQALADEIAADTDSEPLSREAFSEYLGNILHEAGNALMAQANQTDRGVLALLY